MCDLDFLVVLLFSVSELDWGAFLILQKLVLCGIVGLEWQMR